MGIVVHRSRTSSFPPIRRMRSPTRKTLVHTTIWIASIVASWKMQGSIEHNLESVVDVAAFLEGYEPGAALPQTFVWRWLLPHWTLVTTVLSFSAIRQPRCSGRFEAGVMRYRAWVRNKLGAVRDNAHGAYARWPEFRVELGRSLRVCGSLRLELALYGMMLLAPSTMTLWPEK